MPANIGVVHWRDRMTRHGGMLVQRIADPIRHREQITERLITAHAGIAHDHWLPAATEDRRPDVDGADNAPHMRRRVKGGADLVVYNGRIKGTQKLEDRGQMTVHPLGILRARNARDADDAMVRELRQMLPRGWIEKEDCGQAGESGDLHHRRRSGEVITVKGNQRTVSELCRLAHPTASSAFARAGRFAAYSRRSIPSTAASQASRSAATPAAMPPGCAMMPPPAVNMRSVDWRAAKVPGACLADWPDENTGITVYGFFAKRGVRHARADSMTLSSGSENLFASPFTCMWSAPASRQIFCHAT